MLYIASALTPTPIVASLRIQSYTSPNSLSLIVAKPDRLEVWDVDNYGLTFRTDLEIWGNIVSIAEATIDGAPPHILVLTSPSNAHLYLIGYQAVPKPSLAITSTIPLIPPTPSLRQAEFCTKVVSQANAALISLWTGVLSCAEMEVEKDKDAKKRRASIAQAGGDESEGKRLVFRDSFNINVREHNLLDIAFMPAKSAITDPTIAFLWQSSSLALLLQTREVSLSAHALNDQSSAVSLQAPLKDVEIPDTDDFDFNDVPYACPAARYVLPVSSEHVVVMGDEHVVLYSLEHTPRSPRVSRPSISSASGTATSPRASATRRSPQNEMSAPGKRRKSSMASAGRTPSGSGEILSLKPVWRSRQGFGVILSSALLESHSTGASMLISDESGNLTAFGWELERTAAAVSPKGNVQLNKLDLGLASPASALTYLDASHLFISSVYGDSALVEIKPPSPSSAQSSPSSSSARPIPARKGKAPARDNVEGGEWTVSTFDGKGSIVTKERWVNLAPLKDFTAVQDEGGGVSHLVAASGASTSNSLRVIRSGVGLEDHFTIEGLADVTGIFPFGNAEQPAASLLVTTTTLTYMVELHPEPHAVDRLGDLANYPTITAAVSDDSRLVHVNPRAITVLAADASASVVDSWGVGSGEEIVAACISGRYVVVAKKGGEVVVHDAITTGLPIALNIRIPGEVSAVAIICDNSTPSPIFAVSTWSGETHLYCVSAVGVTDPPVTTIHDSHYAISLILRPSIDSSDGSGVQLMQGLSDGTMVIHRIEPSGDREGVRAVNRKASSLGSRPLQLIAVNPLKHGEETVIAIGISERMSVIFENKGRIDFSSASRKDVTAATSIHDPNALVLATPNGLSVSKVNSLKKLSIQTFDLECRSPNKVLSISESRLLGVGSTSKSMDRETGDVAQRSFFELRDNASLDLLVEMPLGTREEVSCLSDVLLNGRRYVAVGTAIVSDEPDEFVHGGMGTISSKAGKLHLVEPRQNGGKWEIVVKTVWETLGPVHDAKVIHGFLAVAAASKVSILRLETGQFGFREVSNFASTFIAQHLHVASATKLHADDRLIVGDGMRSIFELEVDEGSGMIYDDKRDLATHQVMALEGIKDGGDGVIIADGSSNLLTLRLNESIEQAASFGLHEDVVKFQRGSLVPPASAPEIIDPELLYATTDGRLGVIGELTAGATKTLGDLQRNMSKYHKGPGGIEWRAWRRGGNELIKKETAGFVDGDFIQRFLYSNVIAPDEQKKMFEGTNQHERVSKMGQDGKAVEAELSDVVGMLQAVGGLH